MEPVMPQNDLPLVPRSLQVADDVNDPLLCIRARHPEGRITTQLVDIQTKQVEQQKSSEFIKKLQCLYFTNYRRAGTARPALRLKTINAFEESGYVALSYTWRPSLEEIRVPKGGYMVQKIGSRVLKKSTVRNTVFSRMKKYMGYVSVRYLWIDQHCIQQQEGEAKEVGMQAMDRVYSLSDYPATLLARPIETTNQLQLLIEILSGGFVVLLEDRYWLSSSTSSQRALQALQLLNDITTDMWFSRGWTYQENYRASTKMMLLIPHSATLKNKKPPRLFGSLDGELCVKSVDFHEQATKLYLAYESHKPPPRYLDNILSRVGKYTILLQFDDGGGGTSAPVSMSPTIIEHVTDRKLDRKWDRLAIIANCCQYFNRLDSSKLQASGHSLSLSLLTLCLVNGEILYNHPTDGVKVDEARMAPVTEFLRMHFFYGLKSPEPTRKLTFNKGCRFSSVTLTEQGVETKGHLWRLDEEIPTTAFHRDLQRRRSRLRPLTWLANKVSHPRFRILSKRLHEVVDQSQAVTFSQKWQRRMATKMEDAIDQGQRLCTATLLGPGPLGVAIFIIEPDENGSASSETGYGSRSYVFTSFQSERRDPEGFDYNDIDRHVSLEVDCSYLGTDYRQTPKLFTRRWIQGLCFFHGCPPRPVVFPWPASLRDL
ncbi:heterokaryon incompatibility protein-domain-containing protein [Dactylonectria macrodidyma]|uniref:Heterokaryon incompatibility protein-domain-containing protein n=1 Tax=Dactylonectria macrodidyma TaxID=307937 RepID=A0A9P9JHL7_9HYPO|nr:heterokaryon incompatibility protein-domain-containing protein [Dactylonectria macrodidyma]